MKGRGMLVLGRWFRVMTHEGNVRLSPESSNHAISLNTICTTLSVRCGAELRGVVHHETLVERCGICFMVHHLHHWAPCSISMLESLVGARQAQLPRASASYSWTWGFFAVGDSAPMEGRHPIR